MIWNPFKKKEKLKSFMELEVGDIVRYCKEGTCRILLYLGSDVWLLVPKTGGGIIKHISAGRDYMELNNYDLTFEILK